MGPDRGGGTAGPARMTGGLWWRLAGPGAGCVARGPPGVRPGGAGTGGPLAAMARAARSPPPARERDRAGTGSARETARTREAQALDRPLSSRRPHAAPAVPRLPPALAGPARIRLRPADRDRGRDLT